MSNHHTGGRLPVQRGDLKKVAAPLREGRHQNDLFNPMPQARPVVAAINLACGFGLDGCRPKCHPRFQVAFTGPFCYRNKAVRVPPNSQSFLHPYCSLNEC